MYTYRYINKLINEICKHIGKGINNNLNIKHNLEEIIIVPTNNIDETNQNFLDDEINKILSHIKTLNFI